MTTDPPNLAKALLQWVQTFHTEAEVSSLADLREGHILQQILHDIDPTYFSADGLPADTNETRTNWVQRWQNLKHIQHNVDAYTMDVCGVVGESAAGHANMKAIAQAEGHAADAEITQMLKTILRAAMYSPQSNQRMGRVVVGLGGEVAGTIAAAMAGMEEERYNDDEAVAEGSPHRSGPVRSDSSPTRRQTQTGTTTPLKSTSEDKDWELEHEEKIIAAHRIIRQLEESNAKAATELEDLRAEKQRIETAFEALQRDTQLSHDRADGQHIQKLRDKSDQDRDYIAELESELEATRNTSESQARQLERLKTSADTVQKYKDDLQVLRAERDELASKSRTNENLRKKIQNLQDEAKANAQLREDLRQAQDQLSSLDAVRDRCEALQKANAENMNIIASSEQEIFDMRSARKRLEHELRVLGQKYDMAREKQSRDQETIAELETKLAQMGSEDSRGLGEEMELAERPKVERRVSTSARGNGEAEALLEERLAALGRRNKALEEQYLDLLSDKLGLETAVAELTDGTKGLSENPFLEQRAKLEGVTRELQQAKAAGEKLTAELAEAQAQLLRNAGVEVDAAKAHAELGKAFADLTAETSDLRAKVGDGQALLKYALLSARGINSTSTDEERAVHERKLAITLLEEAKAAANLDPLADSVVARVEAARASGTKAQDTSALDAAQQEADALRAELEQVKAQKALEGDKAETDALRKKILLLEKENTLMSSAWCDLSARIQRENISLSRRREDPKSWIGKQRVAVGLGLK